VSKPPITTVASGRCTSAPAPCDSTIGMNPNRATVEAIRIGRSLSVVPSLSAASTGQPLYLSQSAVGVFSAGIDLTCGRRFPLAALRSMLEHPERKRSRIDYSVQ